MSCNLTVRGETEAWGTCSTNILDYALAERINSHYVHFKHLSEAGSNL